MSRFTEQRHSMVRRDLAERGIKDQRVLDAMSSVPREQFVSREFLEEAYSNRALPIEDQQTISQPYVVAFMLDALHLNPDDRALEVGAGSGYALAVLSRVVREAFAVERHPTLVKLARERLQELGCTNAHVHDADSERLGLPDHAPYDAILVSAGAPNVPDSLLQQLAPSGRLVIPVGKSQRDQQLLRITRHDDDDFRTEELGAVAFVPLIGDEAWDGSSSS